MKFVEMMTLGEIEEELHARWRDADIDSEAGVWSHSNYARIGDLEEELANREEAQNDENDE